MLIILFAGIIIFLSDKSRPNRVRTEGNGANWGMRCGDRPLHLGLSPSRPALTLQQPARNQALEYKSKSGFLLLFILFQIRFWSLWRRWKRGSKRFNTAVINEWFQIKMCQICEKQVTAKINQTFQIKCSTSPLSCTTTCEKRVRCGSLRRFNWTEKSS